MCTATSSFVFMLNSLPKRAEAYPPLTALTDSQSLLRSSRQQGRRMPIENAQMSEDPENTSQRCQWKCGGWSAGWVLQRCSWRAQWRSGSLPIWERSMRRCAQYRQHDSCRTLLRGPCQRITALSTKLERNIAQAHRYPWYARAPCLRRRRPTTVHYRVWSCEELCEKL